MASRRLTALKDYVAQSNPVQNARGRLHHGVSADRVRAVPMFRARRTVARRDRAECGSVAFGLPLRRGPSTL